MPLLLWCHAQKITVPAHLMFYYCKPIMKLDEKHKTSIFSCKLFEMTKLNPEVNLASLSWVPTRFLVKLEMMNFSTYFVVIRNFNWAGKVIFWAWHQNRSGILPVDTKYDYTDHFSQISPSLTYI